MLVASDSALTSAESSSTAGCRAASCSSARSVTASRNWLNDDVTSSSPLRASPKFAAAASVFHVRHCLAEVLACVARAVLG